MSNRTFASAARIELVEPSIEVTQRAKAAIATAEPTSVQNLLNFALENKQEDLLYFKAIYATCGFNLNDDVFLADEFWAARKSPVLKPANWQHSDANIIGVLYAVDAQTLDGLPLDIENDKTPTQDFELVVYGVVYKYTFSEFAEEIEKRSKASTLFVSMETWFSDFAYALLNRQTNTISVINRNEQTIALDNYLRCKGGSGDFNGHRIGRVLKGMTFGGMGFVDRPANPRSDALVEVEKIMAEVVVTDNTQVVAALTEIDSLKKDNATAAENLLRAAEKVERAEEAKKVSDAILAKIEALLDNTVAGVGTGAPAEIAKIDNAKTADEKFAAKLAFLAKTGQALSAENEALKAQLATLQAEKEAAAKAQRTAARTAELKALLGDGSDDEIAVLLKGLIDLDDAAYATRFGELKIVAAKSRPTVRHDGGQGSPEAEGGSGEKKVASAPRSDRKVAAEVVDVAAALENATVEATIEPVGTENNSASPFKGLAGLVRIKNNKE